MTPLNHRKTIALGAALATSAAATFAALPDNDKKQDSMAPRPQTQNINKIPAWAKDARWYHAVVPSFCAAQPKRNSGKPHGDLAGLAKRLSYFAELGVNTLYLSSIFSGDQLTSSGPVDLRHIDASLGTTEKTKLPDKESSDPKSWVTTPADKMFLDFIKAAHAKDIRVVAGAPVAQAEPALQNENEAARFLADIARRWMDPDGNGDPSDGIDGWVIPDPDKLPKKLQKHFRKQVKQMNPNALLVADYPHNTTPPAEEDPFDVAINYRPAMAIRRFFDPKSDATLTDLIRDLQEPDAGKSLDRQLSSPVVVSSPALGRLRSALSFHRKNSHEPIPPGIPTTDLNTETTRWRLATVLQHLVPGTPMTYHGDETGMLSTKDNEPPDTLWFTERNAPKIPPLYQADFAALVRFLHTSREKNPAIRHAPLAEAKADESRGLLFLTRSSIAGDVILVINFGDQKQEVQMKVGTPGQTVGFVGPRLINMPPPRPDTGTLVRPLMVGGSRRIVKPDGTTRFWINPKTVRLVLPIKKTDS